MAIDDVYKAELHWIVGDVKAMNVIHFIQTNADGFYDPRVELTQAIQETITNNLLAGLGTDCQLSAVGAKAISPTPSSLLLIPCTGVVGTDASKSIPPSSAVCASFYTATAEKKGRGRMRITGIPKTSITNTNVKQTTLTYLNTFLTALLQGLTWTTGTVIFTGVIYSAVDDVGRTITHFQVHPNVRDQRSRRN